MFRKMHSVAVVLALLAVLTAGAAQARSIAPAPAMSSFAEVWRAFSSLGPAWLKAGGDMDPNGYKHPRGHRPVPRPGRPSGSGEPRVKAGGDMDPNGR